MLDRQTLRLRLSHKPAFVAFDREQRDFPGCSESNTSLLEAALSDGRGECRSMTILPRAETRLDRFSLARVQSQRLRPKRDSGAQSFQRSSMASICPSFIPAWRRAPAAMLIVMFALPCHSESARVHVNIAGLGTERCDVMETGRASKDDVMKWVEGFWSGLNYVAAASGQKQSIVDTDLMLAELEKACRPRPSQILATAAWNAFLALNQR
ncbi:MULTISPECIES: hypothetical protein [unclassified Bradyrhizobium]|uniref:hypothetical protein n=1 Tax=unclassified Bradyrhizobium TaxID=2631580 RepID=UPI00339975BA